MHFLKIKFSHKDMFILMIILLFFSKVVMVHMFLPEKYFYDAETLAYRCRYNFGFDTEPFAWLYHNINVFNFRTRFQWEIPLTVIGNILLLLTFFKNEKSRYSLDEAITILCIVVLSNVYIFQISKDFFQLLLYYLLIIIIKSRIQIYFKILLIFSFLYLEGMYFREYYKLTALIFVLVFFLFLVTIEFSAKKRVITIITTILICFALAKVIMPDKFMEVVNVRDGLTKPKDGSADSVTLIKNIFPGTSSTIYYFINYFINFLRISIPIELLPKGAFYIPFFIFQITLIIRLRQEFLFIFSIDKDSMKLLENDLLILVAMFSYFCVAIIFEPDFGSVVRHEVALYPFVFSLYNSKRYELIKK